MCVCVCVSTHIFVCVLSARFQQGIHVKHIVKQEIDPLVYIGFLFVIISISLLHNGMSFFI